MSDSVYTVSFAGECQPGKSEAEVRQKLAQVLKLDDERVERLFGGKLVVVKKNTDETGARRFKAAFERAGAVCIVDPLLQERRTRARKEPAAPIENLKLPIADLTSNEAEPKSKKPTSPKRPEANPDVVFCRACGEKIARTDETCPACGVRQLVGVAKSKKVAAVLAILFGFVGLHRFYLGQVWGALYLLFSFFAWPLAIVEGIVFLFTSDKKWQEKYGNVPAGGVALKVVAAFGIVAVIGILSAVALPAYQSYIHKAQVADGMVAIDEVRNQIAGYYSANQRMPTEADLDLSIDLTNSALKNFHYVSTGNLTATFDLGGTKTLDFVPTLSSGEMSWDCSGGTMSKSLRPTECLQGKSASSQWDDANRLITSTDGLIRLQLPTSWREIPELGDDMSVRHGNQVKETYVVLLSEARVDFGTAFFLNDFSRALLDNNFEGATNVSQLPSEGMISGMAFEQYRIDATVDSLEVIYLLTTLQSESYFYQLLQWTLPSRWDTHQSTFLDIANSIQENAGQQLASGTGSGSFTAVPGADHITDELAKSHAPRNNVETARNATVFIDTGFGSGSGFFIGSQCTVVTNRHVIELSLDGVRELESQRTQVNALLHRGGVTRTQTQELRDALESLDGAIAAHDGSGNAKQIFVSLVNGREIEAWPLAVSEDRDLAYLALKEKSCPTIKPNPDDDLPLGSQVFTIGNPAGMKYSVTAGIVSGYQSDEDRRFIQTDAAINPGNSGGPLIDPDGRLLGVNTMILRETEGIGFAIPTRDVLADFKKHKGEIDLTLASNDFRTWQPAQRRNEAERDELSPEVLADSVDKCIDAYKNEEWSDASTNCLIAAENGDPMSKYYMATMTYSESDSKAREQAITWYDEAHQEGIAEAQFAMGHLYKDGKYLDHSANYLELFIESCDQDYAPACNSIGIEYLLQNEYDKAPDYFLKAIRQGSIVAIANMAYVYSTGRGVEIDEQRANDLYLQAAKLGRNASQLQIALNYYTGTGVKKDFELAYAWSLVSELDEKDTDTSSEAQTSIEDVRFTLERLLNSTQKEQSLATAKEYLTQIEEKRAEHIQKHVAGSE